MRHFNKTDWSISLSLFLAPALTVIAACIQPSGPLGAPNVIEVGAVSSVRITLAQSALAPGQTTQATVVATSADGRVVGERVDFSSRNPSVATVSPQGVVTALIAGAAMIQATVASRAGSATVTVAGTGGLDTVAVRPRISAFYNFNDGKKGPYSIWSDTDFPADPTGSGRGRVARIRYAPTAGNASADRYLRYHVPDSGKLRYGRTIWMRGDFYLPYAGSDHKAADNRKLIDFGGSSDDGWTGGGVRMIIHRRESYLNPGTKVLKLSALDWMRGNGHEEETVYEETGIVINDDTWYTIEVKMVTNSADNVRDGVLEIYMNGEATPSYRRSTGLGWITEAFTELAPGNIPRVGSYFNDFKVGSQLTIHYPSDPLYTEYRYWDNLGFSTTRIGP